MHVTYHLSKYSECLERKNTSKTLQKKGAKPTGNANQSLKKLELSDSMKATLTTGNISALTSYVENLSKDLAQK